MSRRAAALAVVAGAATWGTTGTSQALSDVAASPVAVGAARTVVGALCLAAVAAAVSPRNGSPASGTPAQSEEWSGDRPRTHVPGESQPQVPGQSSSQVRRARLGPLVVAGIAIAAYQVLFFAGVDATGVAVGTVVGIGSVPVLTGLVAWGADGARPLGRWWAATTLAVAGATLVLVQSGGAEAEVDALGVTMALGAGLAYAVLTVASRRLLDTGMQPTRAMAAVFAIGAVPSAVVLLATDGAALLTPRGVTLVLWLAVVTVALGYVLYARGLRVLSPATVGTLTLTEPLVAAALGIVLLGERPGLLAGLGALLLATGLVLVARGPRQVTSA